MYALSPCSRSTCLGQTEEEVEASFKTAHVALTNHSTAERCERRWTQQMRQPNGPPTFWRQKMEKRRLRALNKLLLAHVLDRPEREALCLRRGLSLEWRLERPDPGSEPLFDVSGNLFLLFNPHKLNSRQAESKGYKMSAAVPFLPMSPALEGLPGVANVLGCWREVNNLARVSVEEGRARPEEQGFWYKLGGESIGK